jgi:hypothetical protein
MSRALKVEAEARGLRGDLAAWFLAMRNAAKAEQQAEGGT